MTDGIYAEMKKREAELAEQKKVLTGRLKKAPEGSLRVSNKNGRVQLYHRRDSADRCGSYLGADKLSMAQKLAQKNYEQEEMKAIDQELEAIAEYFRSYPAVSLEEVYHKLSPVRRGLVTPSIETEEMFLERWKRKYHTDEGFSNGREEFTTDRGEQVRSKSEMIIANMLNRLGVCYCYEPAVTLPGLGTVHPDFAMPDLRCRKTVLLEHLGMLGDPGYADSTVRKINIYILNGYLPGDRLILSMETAESPLNIRALEFQVRRAVLRED